MSYLIGNESFNQAAFPLRYSIPFLKTEIVTFSVIILRYVQIIVNGFWQYLDTVKADGTTKTGWPYILPDSLFYASPIIADVDNDGIEDIILVDSDALIHVLHVSLFSVLSLSCLTAIRWRGTMFTHSQTCLFTVSGSNSSWTLRRPVLSP